MLNLETFLSTMAWCCVKLQRERVMLKKICFSLVLASSLSAAAAGVSIGYEPEGFDELDKQKGLFKTTLVKPDADFSRYTQIQTRTVAVVIRGGGAGNEFTTGRLLTKREKEPVVPAEDEVATFKRIVGEVLETEIEKMTDLEVVDSSGPNTLILQPVITDTVFTSSSKNKSEDGREFPALEQGTIVFDLIDGESGLIVARMAERKRNKPPKGAESAKGAWPNLAYWAEVAADELCQELQRVGG